ncbi:MAG TPA: BON domain-containing protein [Acidobacteriota bacterium]
MSADERRETGGSVGRILWLLLILIVVGAIVYLYWSRNPTFNQAFQSVKVTSQDAATTTAVKTALALSRRVSAFDVNVDSQQGVVTLSGQVPDQEIKQIAGTIAADTAGVSSVNNRLSVNPAARPNPQLARMADRVADLEIKASIQAALLKRPELKNIEVQVEQRAVTLSGVASTGADKFQAEQIAQLTPGIEGLTSHIAVEQAAVEDADAKLARLVEFELFSTKAFDLDRIQVGARAGSITLNGTVRSRAEELLAARIAEQVNGVDAVTNNLSVRAEQAPPAAAPRPPVAAEEGEPQEPGGIDPEAAQESGQDSGGFVR